VKVGEGAGALLALPLVQAAAALAAELPEREPAEPEKTADDSEVEEKNLAEEYDAT
jgi:nicotinate-nucleotide--dimethylbenzimidazole phosphoribosyltransferase